ncbi:DNA cross link repair 1A protein [Trichuris trichiura]|uniref:DNA cross link repair 1A protein n=1 Tax=Trichuris trichiura TaxID=36087 RepID=A0A077Z1E5_TRITR|nr:DNA cross link repair 1A protein [Trichuris trichiura]
MAFDVWTHKDLKSRLRKRSSKQDDQLGASVEAKAKRATQRRFFCLLSLCSSGIECFSITSFIKMKEKFVVSKSLDYSESLQSSIRTSPKDDDLNNASRPPPFPSSDSVQITSQRQTQLTAFFTFSGGITSRAKFPEAKSNDKKVLPEFTGRKNSGKCPFFKFIPGTSCVVDAFMYGYLPQIQMYFLSHFHSDHYSGLNRRFSMPIYCSKITASLVALKLKVDRRFLHVLELNHWSTLPDGTAVMAIDANHCPGAVMFIFKTKNGENILHTGDFRAENIILQNSVWEQIRIDVVFLDTTYCNPEYDFPEQRVVISQALDFIQAKMKVHPKLLIVIGAYTIGKERMFAAIAEAFDCKICVEKLKMQVLNCLDDAPLRERLTLQKKDTFLHVMPMASKLTEYLKVYPSYEHVLGILPTGWQIGSVKRSLLEPFEETNAVTLLGVPYSEHSSYVELKRFVQIVRPKRIIPTVNTSGKETRLSMAQTFSRWLTEG